MMLLIVVNDGDNDNVDVEVVDIDVDGANQVLGPSCGSSLASWTLDLPQVDVSHYSSPIQIYLQLDIPVPYRPPQPPPPDAARAKVTIWPWWRSPIDHPTKNIPNCLPTNQCVMFPISTPFLNPIPQVLHLSDLHVQLGYKEGAASTCGKYPVCCLPGLGVTSFLTFIKQSIIHGIWEQEKAANIKNHRQHCRTPHLQRELESGANTPATFLLGLSTGCLETSQSVIRIYPGL